VHFGRASFFRDAHYFCDNPKLNITNMKKYVSFMLAAAAIGLASCGNNENNTTQEQIDSMATYRTDTMAAALKAQNDSLIEAMARMRADSAMRADSLARLSATRKSATRTTKSSTGTRTQTGTKPATIGNGKPAMGSGSTPKSNTVGEGKPRMGDKNNNSSSSKTVGEGKPKMGEK
jgi:hypothetical protein